MVTALNNLRSADCYIRRIRNSEKRAYAEVYWAYLLDKTDIPPLSAEFNLSYMAAQAVRLELHKFISGGN